MKKNNNNCVLYGKNRAEHLFSTKWPSYHSFFLQNYFKMDIGPTSIKADNVWVFKFAKK